MGKFTEYSLPLKALPKGTHDFSFHLGEKFFTDMESADIRDADVTAAVTVKYDGEVYDLTFHVTGEVTVLCDRCLDEMQLPIDAGYHIMVKYGDAFRDDSDELLEIPGSTNDLNVAYMMYDTVSLAVPIKHVHPMGKCNRQMSAILRKHRATDANDPDADLENELIDEMESAPAEPSTDPRWNALRDIAGDGDSEE